MRNLILIFLALVFVSCSKEEPVPDAITCEWAGAKWCLKVGNSFFECKTFGKDGSFNNQYYPVIRYESNNCIEIFIYENDKVIKKHKVRNVTNKYMEINDWYQTPYKGYYKQ
jgi:hypothetical protein